MIIEINTKRKSKKSKNRLCLTLTCYKQSLFLVKLTLLFSRKQAYLYHCNLQNNYIHHKKISSIVQYHQHYFLPYNLPFYFLSSSTDFSFIIETSLFFLFSYRQLELLFFNFLILNVLRVKL